eukprot:10306109-Lingulodinium_polyedra.AAC.1
MPTPTAVREVRLLVLLYLLRPRLLGVGHLHHPAEPALFVLGLDLRLPVAHAAQVFSNGSYNVRLASGAHVRRVLAATILRPSCFAIKGTLSR